MHICIYACIHAYMCDIFNASIYAGLSPFPFFLRLLRCRCAPLADLVCTELVRSFRLPMRNPCIQGGRGNNIVIGFDLPHLARGRRKEGGEIEQYEGRCL